MKDHCIPAGNHTNSIVNHSSGRISRRNNCPDYPIRGSLNQGHTMVISIGSRLQILYTRCFESSQSMLFNLVLYPAKSGFFNCHSGKKFQVRHYCFADLTNHFLTILKTELMQFEISFLSSINSRLDISKQPR